MKSYTDIIQTALSEGGLLDALLAVQKKDGYVTEQGLCAVAETLGMSVAELYDTASFYSMLRFQPSTATEIRVCRGTACYSGGNKALVEALEKITGLKPGESNDQYSVGWVECLGQCQAAPSMLINGKLYIQVEIEKIPELLGGEK